MAAPDNFKHHKHVRPRRLSTDGILPPGKSKAPGTIDFKRNTKEPGGIATIDDFNRPEGFNSGYQSIVSDSMAVSLPASENNQRLISPSFEKPRSRRRPGQKPHKFKKFFLRSISGLAVSILLIAGFLFVKGYIKSHNIFQGGATGAAALQDEVNPSLLKTEGDGRINILVLGKGGEGHDGADLTDTLLLISIDPVQKEAGLLSIPRDFYVKVPGDGSEKINAVYANAKSAVLTRGKLTSDLQKKAEQEGISKVQSIVSQTLGVPIHYHVMLDFEAFRQAIDTVGGITINVKQQVYDPSVAWENNNNSMIAKVGTQTFNGKQALLYARSRHGSPRGDFDRSERQREIIMALKDKLLSTSTFTNPIKISQLLDAFGNHVQTDLSMNEVLKLNSIAKNIPSGKVFSIGLADPPVNLVTTGNVGGLSVVIPVAGTYKYDDIQSYLRNTFRDSYLRKENATIAVLNGTSLSGLATQKATLLRSLGYNVSQTGDAPTKAYSKTILVDLHGNNKYTKHYLEQRFRVSAFSTIPDKTIDTKGADFVIILGSDQR